MDSLKKFDFSKLNNEQIDINEMKLTSIKRCLTKNGKKLVLHKLFLNLMVLDDTEDTVQKHKKYFFLESKIENLSKSVYSNRIKNNEEMNEFEKIYEDVIKNNDEKLCNAINEFDVNGLAKYIISKTKNNQYENLTVWDFVNGLREYINQKPDEHVDGNEDKILFKQKAKIVGCILSEKRELATKKYTEDEDEYGKRLWKIAFGGIKNKAINYALKQGKIKYYKQWFKDLNGEDIEVDSHFLERIHIEESFAKAKEVAIAFASNTYRNNIIEFLKSIEHLSLINFKKDILSSSIIEACCNIKNEFLWIDNIDLEFSDVEKKERMIILFDKLKNCSEQEKLRGNFEKLFEKLMRVLMDFSEKCMDNNLEFNEINCMDILKNNVDKIIEFEKTIRNFYEDKEEANAIIRPITDQRNAGRINYDDLNINSKNMLEDVFTLLFLINKRNTSSFRLKENFIIPKTLHYIDFVRESVYEMRNKSFHFIHKTSNRNPINEDIKKIFNLMYKTEEKNASKRLLEKFYSNCFFNYFGMDKFNLITKGFSINKDSQKTKNNDLFPQYKKVDKYLNQYEKYFLSKNNGSKKLLIDDYGSNVEYSRVVRYILQTLYYNTNELEFKQDETLKFLKEDFKSTTGINIYKEIIEYLEIKNIVSFEDLRNKIFKYNQTFSSNIYTNQEKTKLEEKTENEIRKISERQHRYNEIINIAAVVSFYEMLRKKEEIKFIFNVREKIDTNKSFELLYKDNKDKIDFKYNTSENQLSEELMRFYVFCKCLDNNSLSNLRHEYVRYQIAYKKNRFQNCTVENSHINIMDLCLFNNNDQYEKINTKNINDKDIYNRKYFNIMKKFIDVDENPENLKEFNFQISDETGTKRKILFYDDGTSQGAGTIIQTNKIDKLFAHGTNSILNDIDFNENIKYKICLEDIRSYANIEAQVIKEYDDKNKIIKEHKDKKIEQQNKNLGNRKATNLTKSDEERLNVCNEKIKKYVDLKNKITLNHVMDLDYLLVQVLSKEIELMFHLERDLMFLAWYVIDNPEKININYNNIFDYIKKINEENSSENENNYMNIISKHILITKKIGDSFNRQFACFKDFRNTIAHLNFLSDNTKRTHSIKEQIQILKRIFEYDSKMRNNIYNSFTKIFEKNNLILTNNLEILPKDEIYRDITCENGKNLKYEKTSKLYLQMTKSMFEYKES